MHLLVITQKVDTQDSVLGFFHTWLEQMAGQVDTLSVICLYEGQHHLSSNVYVYSLGKEQGVSRWKYLWRFYRYIIAHRKEYEGVLVHMNPEYVVLGGFLWRWWRKKVLLWYVHKAVNLRLRLAEKFATKIFTASKESFRLPSRKMEVVGHGIEIDRFSLRRFEPPISAGICLLHVGRIARSKDVHTVLLVTSELAKTRKVQLDLVGEPILPEDLIYQKELLHLVERLYLTQIVHWSGGKSYEAMPEVYQTHHYLIHTSQTGSIDKVVLEAIAAGTVVFASSEAYRPLGNAIQHFSGGEYQEVASHIEKMWDSAIIHPPSEALTFVRTAYSLDALIQKIVRYLGQ